MRRPSKGLEIYPFRFRDPVSGKWVRARYKAARDFIAEHYAEWEITGEPEVVRVDATATFNPYRITPHAEMKRMLELPPEINPQIDDAERSMLLCFLRRYVTYCCRRGRFAQMQGAAQLLRQVARYRLIQAR